MKKIFLLFLGAAALCCSLRPALAQGPARLPTVVLGDSITEGAQWPQNFPTDAPINMGVSGDTTLGMLARVDQVMAAKPGKVLVMAGINDLLRGRPVADVLATYGQLLARLDDGGKRLVIQSTLYVRPPSNVLVNDSVRALNEGLLQMCTANRRCTFIDINEVVAPAGFLIAADTTDGLHLNTAGYLAWFQRLRERKILE
ncbi:MAG: GDSL-type esterase/lipase family protein [Pseudomonadota bacterium]